MHRGHVEAWHVCHYGCDLGVGEFYLGCAVGVDAEADRLSFADGVATCTRTRSATPAATRFFAMWRAA